MQRATRLATAFPAADDIGTALLRKGWTVAVGESCTGGLLGAVLTSVPGSSRWVRGGVIAYDNQLKVELLGVDPDLIAHRGAVDETVAEQMARGARTLCGADIGVGVTGIAGPATDATTKPVGLIYICAVSKDSAVHRRLEGDRGREANRTAAVVAALEACLALLG